MLKKIFLFSILALLILIGGFFLWLFIKYKSNNDPDKTFILPRLQMSEYLITGFTEDTARLQMKMLIKNEVPFAFRADSLVYKISIAGVEVMRSSYATNIKLKGNESSTIELPVTVLNATLKNILNKEENKGADSVEYSMEATFFIHIPFKKQAHVNIKKTLPLLHIPEMQLNDVDIDSLRLSGATIQLHTAIKNENVFALEFKDMQYVLFVDDKKWAEGDMPGEIKVPAKSTTEIVIPAKLDFGEISKAAFTVLMRSNTLDYNLKANMYLISDKKQINNSKVFLESKGKVKPLLHALKK